jgi:hypothetical protein
MGIATVVMTGTILLARKYERELRDTTIGM